MCIKDHKVSVKNFSLGSLQVIEYCVPKLTLRSNRRATPLNLKQGLEHWLVLKKIHKIFNTIQSM